MLNIFKRLTALTISLSIILGIVPVSDLVSFTAGADTPPDEVVTFFDWDEVNGGHITRTMRLVRQDIPTASQIQNIFENESSERVSIIRSQADFHDAVWIGNPSINVSNTSYVNANEIALLDHWYIIDGTFTLSARLIAPTVGTARIILMDNARLTIDVANSLGAINTVSGTPGNISIYAQSTRQSMGQLDVNNSLGRAIIVNGSPTNGIFTVNGGNVKATSTSDSTEVGANNAGIGLDSNGSTLVVNGGSIEAHGGLNGAGISVGNGGITVRGGSIKAVGNGTGAGIGANGATTPSGTITITSGIIEAIAGSSVDQGNGSAMGRGNGGDEGGITVNIIGDDYQYITNLENFPPPTTDEELEIGEFSPKSEYKYIKLMVGIYELELDSDPVNFEDFFGYMDIPQKGIPINNAGNRNTGDLKIVLSGDNADVFELSGKDNDGQDVKSENPGDAITIGGINSNTIGSFSVAPINELDAGTYNAQITVSFVSGNSTEEYKVDVTFKVKPAEITTVNITVDEPRTGTPQTDTVTGSTSNFGDYNTTLTLNQSNFEFVNAGTNKVQWSPVQDPFGEDTYEVQAVLRPISSNYVFADNVTASINEVNVTSAIAGVTPGVVKSGDVEGAIIVRRTWGAITAPTVVSVLPSALDERHPVSGNIVVTFDRVMDTSAGTVQLTPNHGNFTSTVNVAGSNWGVGIGGRSVLTIPYSGLLYNTNYTITLAGFKDTAGNQVLDYKVSGTPDRAHPYAFSTITRIDVANIEVDAPAVAIAPNPTATIGAGSNSGFEVSNVTWSPALSPTGRFIGGTVYTATVTLTAVDAYHFFAGGSNSGSLTATVNGFAPTTIARDDVERTVTLTYTFPITEEAIVSNITPGQDPTTMSYTHGDPLSLAGLEAIVHYNDGTTKTAKYNDGDFAPSRYNITTTLESGNILAVVGNPTGTNGRGNHGDTITVRIPNPAGGFFTFETGALTVNKATPTVALVARSYEVGVGGFDTTLSATVTGIAGAIPPGGQVRFVITREADGVVTYAYVNLEATGDPNVLSATAVEQLQAGNHDIMAEYVGDVNYDAANCMIDGECSLRQYDIKKIGPELTFTTNADDLTREYAENLTINVADLIDVRTPDDGEPGAGVLTYSISGTASATGGTVAASTINTNTGVLTVRGAGTITVTVSVAATATHNPENFVITITITPKPVTVTTPSVGNKVYDGDNTVPAASIGTATINGLVNDDTVTLTGGSATFDEIDVDNDIPVTFSNFALGGTHAGNYTITQPAKGKANITPKEVTVTQPSVPEKVYNGTTNATISNRTSMNIYGLVTADIGYVTLEGGTAAFADKDAANGKTVTFSGFGLGGAKAGNYTLTPPGNGQANIIAKPITPVEIIGVTPPRTGNVIADNNTANPNHSREIDDLDWYMVDSVTWSRVATPAEEKFRGDSVYTVTVVVSTNTNHTFEGLTLANAKIDGETATSRTISNAGKTVTLTYTFTDPTARARISDIEIVTPPKMDGYTHGDDLDLSALEILIKYEDGTDNADNLLKYDDIDAFNNDPNNGNITLTISDGGSIGDKADYYVHDGKSIIVTYDDGKGNELTGGEALTADTNTLPKGTFDITAPEYKIEITPKERDFGSVPYTEDTDDNANTAQPAAQFVTVTNTGNQPTGALGTTISGLNPTAFEIVVNNAAVAPGILVGGNQTISVRPVANLGVGKYEATVVVTGNKASSTGTFSDSFTVKFEVIKGTRAAPNVAAGDSEPVTTNGGSDGKITGLTPNEPYIVTDSEGGRTTRTADVNGEITGLPHGTYTVSYPANSNFEESPPSNSIPIAQPYTLTFTPNPTDGGTITRTFAKAVTDGAEEAYAGTIVTITAVPTPGYEFVNWTTTSSGVTFASATAEETTFTMPGNNVTITANFNPATYTITYNIGDGTWKEADLGRNSYTHTEGKTLPLADTLNPPPPADGHYYVFGGWEDSEGAIVTEIPTDAHGNKTFTAVWTQTTNLYTVTFNTHSGTPQPAQIQDVPHGSTINAHIAPETIADPIIRAGYRFDGWFTAETGGTKWELGTDSVTSNITLHAQWTEQFTVTWNVDGNPPTTSIEHDGETIKNRPTPDPEKEGHTFDGWYTEDGDEWIFATDLVDEDTTLYAQFTPKPFNVTWDYNWGTSDSPTPTVDANRDFGSTITAPNPNPDRIGYAFKGWRDVNNVTRFDEDRVSIGENTVPVGGITYYAIWDINKYTVTWNPNGGMPAPAQISNVEHGTPIDEPAKPTLFGYELDYWYTIDAGGDEHEWDFDDGVTSSMTLHAKWKDKEFKVTFDAGEGATFPDDGGGRTVIIDTQEGEPVDKDDIPTPDRGTDYEFDGWYVGDEEWNPDDGVTSDITITARWAVHVTWDANGGTNPPAPTKVTLGNPVAEPATTPTPPSGGKEFKGWALDKDYDGAKDGDGNDEFWKFNTLITAPTTLYAIWGNRSFNITYDLDGGTGNPGGSYDYGTGISKDDMPKPTKPGYDFDGWYEGNTEVEEIGDDRHGDIDLTAKWAKLWTVTVSGGTVNGTGGNIRNRAPNGTSAQFRENWGVNITAGDPPETYQRFSHWSVTAGSVDASSGTFTMPGNDVSITAVFESEIRSIKVTPNPASVFRGDSITFAASVEVYDGAAQTVTWTIESPDGTPIHSGTTISDSGVLTVSAEEQNTTLRVRATSTVDTNMSGTATANIFHKPVDADIQVDPPTARRFLGQEQDYTAISAKIDELLKDFASTLGYDDDDDPITANASVTYTWELLDKDGNAVVSTITYDKNTATVTIASNETKTDLTVKVTATVKRHESDIDPIILYGTASLVVEMPNITINSPASELSKGNTYQFEADLQGMPPDTPVTWSIDGANDPETKIDPDTGELVVGRYETSENITVTAVVEYLGEPYSDDENLDIKFVPVESITDVPTSTVAGDNLTLTGTVGPSNATNQTIVWEIVDDGGTGAKIIGGELVTDNYGEVIVRAIIKDGKGDGEDYEQEFTIIIRRPTYEITLDANGGNLSTDTITTRESDGKVGSIPTPTRPGYIFEGWFDSDGNLVTTDYVFSSDATITAQWRAVEVRNNQGSGGEDTPERNIGFGTGNVGMYFRGKNDGTRILYWFENHPKIMYSGVELILNINLDYSTFLNEVKINGIVLTEGEHYTSRSGSTIIDFNPDYLNTLGFGQHTISVKFQNFDLIAPFFIVDDVSSGTDMATRGISLNFGGSNSYNPMAGGFTAIIPKLGGIKRKQRRKGLRLRILYRVIR
ncbi:MAG: InlB B-repeat-containing protein [Oscillospiraceae bacterium]|nr:InlB B-repeat-containing protein [Oscillospiraceae bacterium]